MASSSSIFTPWKICTKNRGRRGSFATDLLAEKHCKEELRDGPSEEGQGGEDSTPRGGAKESIPSLVFWGGRCDHFFPMIRVFELSIKIIQYHPEKTKQVQNRESKQSYNS